MFKTQRFVKCAAACAVALSCAWAHATITIDTVPVGNPGNTGELSGQSVPGGYGLDRICGKVDYTYNIGKYEVTAGQYTAFLNAVAKTDTYGLYNTQMDSSSYGCQITRLGASGNYTYDFSGRPIGTEADWANRPVNYVSYGDAMRFANWLHNGQLTGGQNSSTTEDGAYFVNGATNNAGLLAVSRKGGWKWAVTSEDESYKAAYHDKTAGQAASYFDYPTATNAVPSNVLSNPLPDPGNNANYFGPTYPGSYTIGPPYYRTEVGDFENSVSPYGTFDQGGNVWEWNESVLYGSSRGLRGGAFFNYENPLRASYRGGYYSPTGEEYSVGFRVANIPEPGGLAMLLGCALLGLMCWWRRRA